MGAFRGSGGEREEGAGGATMLEDGWGLNERRKHIFIRELNGCVYVFDSGCGRVSVFPLGRGRKCTSLKPRGSLSRVLCWIKRMSMASSHQDCKR